jgi:hypothetical protein
MKPAMIKNSIALRNKFVTAIISVTLLVSAALPTSVLAAETSIPFKNTGMEDGKEKPDAWSKGLTVAGVVQTWDQTVAHGGKGSLCLKKTGDRYFPIAQWTQTVGVEPAGKRRKLQVRCWVKAENVAKAIIDLSYEAATPGHVWAVYLGQKKPTDPVLTHDWKFYMATVDVPAQVSNVGIGLQIYGPGAVWFDDLEVAWLE